MFSAREVVAVTPISEDFFFAQFPSKDCCLGFCMPLHCHYIQMRGNNLWMEIAQKPDAMVVVSVIDTEESLQFSLGIP